MFKILVISLSSLLFAGGCSFYKPMPLDRDTVARRLSGPDMNAVTIEAREIHHPLLSPVEINLEDGLSPDEAALVAVVANPELRVARNERGLAQAQLIAAGILPNPEVGFGMGFPRRNSNTHHPWRDLADSVSGPAGEALGTSAGNAVVNRLAPAATAAPPGGTAGGGAAPTVAEKLANAYDLSVQWEITSLLPLLAKMKSAKAHAAAVNLDIAWQEWQTAESAKLHVYRLLSLERQVRLARESEKGLAENRKMVREAVALRAKTVVELAAAEVAFQQNHLTLLTLEQATENERLELNKTLGMPPALNVPLQRGIELPTWPTVPTVDQIMAGIDDCRLDLVALKIGYQSQEEKLRAEILVQFPKITLGYALSRDTGRIITPGFTSTFAVPLFDRNQGAIATEKATRQQLFDEYVSRLFQARAEAAKILNDIRSGKAQLKTNEQSVVDQQRLVEVYSRALRQGNADVLSYYTARLELINKQIEVLKLKMELVEQSIALELAAGRYFEHGAGKEMGP